MITASISGDPLRRPDIKTILSTFLKLQKSLEEDPEEWQASLLANSPSEEGEAESAPKKKK